MIWRFWTSPFFWKTSIVGILFCVVAYSVISGMQEEYGVISIIKATLPVCFKLTLIIFSIGVLLIVFSSLIDAYLDRRERKKMERIREVMQQLEVKKR